MAGTFQGGNLIVLSLYVLPAVLLGWWLGEKMFFSDQPAFIQTHCAAGGVDRRSDDAGQWYQWRAALNLL
ncbi:MAG: hypothetical protein LUH17_00015 [Acidaminococcaceae bacterium]|nr:hypothetical protein [Acidaminococcaceae bacterium]